MTLAKTGTETLTQEEWNELLALKEAISYAPQTVSAEKMENVIPRHPRTGVVVL